MVAMVTPAHRNRYLATGGRPERTARLDSRSPMTTFGDRLRGNDDAAASDGE